MTTGPYTYLRHPSYTGLILNFVGTFGLFYYEGLWDVGIASIARMAAYLVHRKVPILTTMILMSPFSPHSPDAGVAGTVLGISTGLWMTVIYTMLSFKQTRARIAVEEEMLKRHFGTEWDAYAQARWRLFPFI